MSERIGHGDGVELTNISEECTLCGADVISMIANEGFVSQTTRPIFRTQVYEVFPPRLRGASFSVTIEVSSPVRYRRICWRWRCQKGSARAPSCPMTLFARLVSFVSPTSRPAARRRRWHFMRSKTATGSRHHASRSWSFCQRRSQYFSSLLGSVPPPCGGQTIQQARPARTECGEYGVGVVEVAVGGALTNILGA